MQEYVKPTFYVEVIGDAETVQPGGTLKVLVRARRYAGGAPEKTRYEVFLYRAVVDSPAWVDDAGLGAQGSAVTYGSASTTEGKLSVPSGSTRRPGARPAVRRGPVGLGAAASTRTAERTSRSRSRRSRPATSGSRGATPCPSAPATTRGTSRTAPRPCFLAPSEVLGLVRPGAVVTVAGTDAPLAIRATSLSGSPYASAAGRSSSCSAARTAARRALGAGDPTRPTACGAAPSPRRRRDGGRAGHVEDRQGRPWTGEASLLVTGKKGEEAVRVPSLQLATAARRWRRASRPRWSRCSPRAGGRRARTPGRPG